MTYHFEKINPFYGCIESKYVSRKTCISCQLKTGFGLSKCKNIQIRLMTCKIEILTKETIEMHCYIVILIFPISLFELIGDNVAFHTYHFIQEIIHNIYTDGQYFY